MAFHRKTYLSHPWTVSSSFWWFRGNCYIVGSRWQNQACWVLNITGFLRPGINSFATGKKKQFFGQLHLHIGIFESTTSYQDLNQNFTIMELLGNNNYYNLSWMYGFFLSVSSCYWYSLHVIRPAGIPVVPVYEEDEPSAKRKVQRITSPEKWEIKQVNHCVFSQLA